MPQKPQTNAFGDTVVETQGTNAFGDPIEGTPSIPKPVTVEASPQTFAHGITEFGKQINPIPMITGAANAIAHPLDTARNIYGAQKNELGQVPGLVRQGRYSEAAGHGLAGITPLVGPAAAKIGETIGGTDTQAPDPVGGIGAGAGLIASILAAPKVSETAGKLLKGTAGPLVKSALNLPGKAEAYGANPAAAILTDTNGIRPSTIASTGRQKIASLGKDLDTAAANSTVMPSLTSARNVVSEAMKKASSFNSSQMPSEVQPMQDFLTKPQAGFTGRTEFAPGVNTPISFKRQAGMAPGTPRLIRGAAPDPVVAAEQPATNFLGMKRQFDTDFIRNWNPAVSTKGRLGVARQAYGAMADELNRTVPGAEQINSRLQDLIPAVDRAKATSLNAGVMQKAMSRISSPTGALVPALIGRQMGGVPGLLAGIGAPEMMSAPAVKMAIARSLYGAGNGLASQAGQRLIQAPTLLRQNQR